MEPPRRSWSFALGLAVTAQGLLFVPFLPLLVIGIVTAFRGHMDHGDWNVLKSGAIGSAVCVAVIVFNPYRSAVAGTYGHMLRPASWTRKSKIIGAVVIVVVIAASPFLVHQQRIADTDQRKQIGKIKTALAVVQADRPTTTAGAIALLTRHHEIGLAPVSGAAGEHTLSVVATPDQVVLMTSSIGECVAVVDNRQTVHSGLANAPEESGLWHIVYIPGTGKDDHCDASRLPAPQEGQVGLFHATSWSRGPFH